MKYLKESAEIHTEKIKEALSNIINWRMIEDIKDMSLEYLDNGSQLTIFIYLGTGDPRYYRDQPHFYAINYSHDVNNGVWDNKYRLFSRMQMRDISPDKLRYRINLFNRKFNNRRDLWDLVGRIKRVYKEKITMS